MPRSIQVWRFPGSCQISSPTPLAEFCPATFKQHCLGGVKGLTLTMRLDKDGRRVSGGEVKSGDPFGSASRLYHGNIFLCHLTGLSWRHVAVRCLETN